MLVEYRQAEPIEVAATISHEKGERGIRQLFWEYDNEYVMYLKDRDGHEKWHVYQTSLKDEFLK